MLVSGLGPQSFKCTCPFKAPVNNIGRVKVVYSVSDTEQLAGGEELYHALEGGTHKSNSIHVGVLLDILR